jgi:probable O-glycosylation ligase (exosortase A-associated)
VAVLVVMMMRSVKRKMLYIGVIGGLLLVAIPLLPQSFTERMNTIRNHQSDQSASTRVAVWQWTIEYAKRHPFGGGFEAYRQNVLSYDTIQAENAGDNNTAIETQRIEERGRAYHSSYFEMLGEQGYPGLALWLLLHILGVIHMEVIRRAYAKDKSPELGWVTPLADALQQAQIVYLFGGAFVGIAFQPFCYMLVGLQCGLSAYIGRVKRAVPKPFRAPRPAPAKVRTEAPA